MRSVDGDGVEIKVPTFRPTPTVHSVLGLLPGEYNNPVGTSIQLLPSAAPAAAPAQDTVAAHPERAKSDPDAIATTRQRGFPAWIAPAEPAGVAATSDAETGGTETIDTEKEDRSQDSWRPRGEARQPKPLREPMPALTAPQTGATESGSTSGPSHSVGSGLPSLSPVKEPPSLDSSPVQTQRTEQTQQTERLPALDDLPDQAAAATDTDLAAKALQSKMNAHEGNNEGDAPGPVEASPWDGMTADEIEDADRLQPSLSTIDIKPLVLDPAQDQATGSAPNLSVPTDLQVKPSIGSITQRDATGRIKTHAGSGAFADLDPAISRLQQPILTTLRRFHAQTEKADSRSNWGMMHAIMVYGIDTRIIARRRNYSAIAWMAGNNVCRGNRLMTTERGQIKIRQGTGLQGHQAQWLATLSLAGVPANYPLYADNQRFTIEDLVQVEAASCEEGVELTFTLIGLAHYLDTNATWAGVRGEPWDFERLIAAELDQPIVGAACGGTHRLMGFAHALRKRRLEGQPITGQWNRAEKFLDDFVEYTYTLQNRDGSFSTNWFESPQDNGDVSRKVQTTGHILEFLLTHLPDEELGNDHVVTAVRFLTGAMRRVKMDDAGVGYRAHALRSLAMFHERVYGTAPVYPPGQMAFGQHRNERQR